ncbi:hypothetical protein [Streptomyces sp. NPDC004728]|uniref:hypothetical protein n=1 Tax=Streptomyces sp. NPDC004728 TaxID=3154289 RepID=UPI0033A6BBE3
MPVPPTHPRRNLTVHRTITALAAAALALTASAFVTSTANAADLARDHLSGPPVTVLQCEAGGGFVATDIRTRQDFCAGGTYNNRYVIWL